MPKCEIKYMELYEIINKNLHFPAYICYKNMPRNEHFPSSFWNVDALRDTLKAFNDFRNKQKSV